MRIFSWKMINLPQNNTKMIIGPFYTLIVKYISLAETHIFRFVGFCKNRLLIAQKCSTAFNPHRVSEKRSKIFFCYNYIKLPPNLIIFGTKMANSLNLYEVHSFSTSPNSRQCIAVLNADAPNCYITLQLNKSSVNFQTT